MLLAGKITAFSALVVLNEKRIIKTIKNSEDLKTSEEFNASDTLNELLTIDAESKVIEDEK